MYNVMFVNFYLRPSTVDKTKGSVYVEARVNSELIVLGAVTSISDLNLPKSMMIEASHWDNKKKRVKQLCNHATVINKAITECENKLQKIYAQHEGGDKKMTAKGLRKMIRHGGRMLPSFPDLLEKFLAERKAIGTKQSTIETYSYKFKPLTEFLKHEGILDQPAEEFTAGTLKRYRTYLITHRGNSTRTADKTCQAIKTILIWAADNEHIKFNPLLYTRIRVDKTPNLECLTQDEVRMVAEANLIPMLRKTADCFVFACYTGLAYQDLKDLTQASLKVVEGVHCIVGRRMKTGTDYCIPITEPVWSLIDKYGGLKLPVASNQYYNSSLKQVMHVLGIEKRITTHTARKTFCDWCINELGLSEEATIVAMGQKAAKELTPYRRTRPKRLLSEFPTDILHRNINPIPFVNISKAS